jgi:Flp pilus assembly pilin Flp
MRVVPRISPGFIWEKDALGRRKGRLLDRQEINPESANDMKLKIRRFIFAFGREDEAATAVEYAVMLMLIIAVSIVLIQGIGISMEMSWTDSKDKFVNAINN